MHKIIFKIVEWAISFVIYSRMRAHVCVCVCVCVRVCLSVFSAVKWHAVTA